MKIVVWLTNGMWVAFVAYWVMAAVGAKKRVGGRSFRQQVWLRLLVLAIVFILMRGGVFHPATMTDLAGSLDQSATRSVHIVLGVGGVLLCVVGFGLAVWARVYLGRNWGMPMTLQQEHELVTSGPYAWVRHPIYSGFLLAMLGSIFANGRGWLVALVCFGAYFIYSAKTEEAIMSQAFPTAYPAYMKRTKMLIPFLL